ncbi:DUF5360 family protein [Nocardia sp. NPDC004654]|uniref:DUF5360 family protein n=1 Tax=Nocardia sp. NPDC004654 TaxID=3154776 RepID=UPI0033BE86ED
MADARFARTKRIMLWTDLGFLAYWVATALGALSVGTDPFLRQWNWSFLGLDLAAIGIGLASLAVAGRQPALAERMMLVSLTATAAAGLMALNFYLVRCEFDPAWWIPNAWLLFFPIVAMTTMMVTSAGRGRIPDAG